MTKEFKSPCNESELLFLESLAKEHPKDIQLSYKQDSGSKKLDIQISSENVKDYVIWMLDRFRKNKDSLQTTYDIVDWDYSG
jgi:hypothetical protein